MKIIKNILLFLLLLLFLSIGVGIFLIRKNTFHLTKWHAPTTNGLLEINAVIGASIGYQVDDGRWQLYQAPISMKEFKTIKIKAVRYGWEESEVVILKM